jgi:hypothetical protein
MEQAIQITDSDATNANTLSPRLDTKPFMEASLPTIKNCFGELSGDGIESTALRKADYNYIAAYACFFESASTNVVRTAGSPRIKS